jgi:two-component system response regulator RegX3
MTLPLGVLPWRHDGRPRVLVADEDETARTGLQRVLRNDGDVTACEDGAEALWHAGRVAPWLVVLSSTLPVVPAATVASVLAGHRAEGPAIAVGIGPNEAESAAAVLAAGADAVLSRPYRPAEVRGLLQRRAAALEQDGSRAGVLEAGPVRLDGPAFRATARGTQLNLTLRGFELLALLVLHAGKVVSHQHVRELLWRSSGDTATGNAVSVHVRHLRQHLAGVAEIVAVRGLGYRLQVMEDRAVPERSDVSSSAVGYERGSGSPCETSSEGVA